MDSIRLSFSRTWIVLGRYLFAAIWGMCLILFFSGLFIVTCGDVEGVLLMVIFSLLLFLFSRISYIPIEFSPTHIECASLFWNKKIPIQNITWIMITTYADFLYRMRRDDEYESILFKIDGVFLRYIFFPRLKKRLGIGEYLIERIRELKGPNARIVNW